VGALQWDRRVSRPAGLTVGDKMTDEATVKYDHLAMLCFGELYWELTDDQRLEVRDLHDEQNT
jgi:hypothetical protein